MRAAFTNTSSSAARSRAAGAACGLAICVPANVWAKNSAKNARAGGCSVVKSTGCARVSGRSHAPRARHTHLEYRERERALRDEPRVQPRDVAAPALRDLLCAVERARAVADALEHFRAADTSLAERAEEVPERELERDLVRVRLCAQVREQECIIRVVCLLLRARTHGQRRAAAASGAGNVRYRNSAARRVQPRVAGPRSVRAAQGARMRRRSPVCMRTVSLAHTLRCSNTHVATHKHDEHTPADVRVHALLPCEREQRALRGRLIPRRSGCHARSVGRLTVDERITAPRCADKPPAPARVRRAEVRERHPERLVRAHCRRCQHRAARHARRSDAPLRRRASPARNLDMRSSASAPPLAPAPPVLRSLLFFRFDSVSSMKRVRELRARSQRDAEKGTRGGAPERVLVPFNARLHEQHDVLERARVVRAQLRAGVCTRRVSKARNLDTCA
jgi:hypothetical protein